VSQLERRRYCRTCRQKRLFVKQQSISLGMGCLLTVLTGGAFIIIWLLIGFLDMFKPFRCRVCGQANHF
jgi:hypothetical protein